MAALIKGLKLASQIQSKNPALFALAVRNAHGWNKDFKPAKFPETDKEREAAARKYGLHPAEYQPYPNDGLGYGDYPKLADTPVEARDPYYPYDFPELKRNLHEPLHAESDLWGENMYGSAERTRYPMRTYWLAFLGVMAGCLGLYYWLEDYKMFRPVLAKQYARDGKHYTFDSK
ncbi:NADH-ubiquinone oxidoreductase ashi subunit [Culex quinquefasciatus]|uniref:NADH-ubiquinone oxidoreductase ashi subunit n=1 Tax=Culex quinquefasciatus TaxID=7176 RepID=B0W496_CULQU|nr:NADH dehydrogenase [ubiquinone] 1 beta subcomplex subunit 8, mitochondrial [Culex quinquefasciatus]XP_039437594.1 NADH dehydrogenase [ubiquinone] 1 beta subcomplex subunit 8, mitochondrial [Culex pipiens pallens]EDS33181.1 NADH-ubiquinone oxidoreductase ashi subunit [Culex quinquefasciatus]|eukprot:XP_001843538.1 NADH-ubiquinone oxidoreductase ashi subunit [Culex quinquefasciatus]